MYLYVLLQDQRKFILETRLSTGQAVELVKQHKERKERDRVNKDFLSQLGYF